MSEKEQARTYHVVDVLHACCHIMDLERAYIKRRDFLKDTSRRAIIDSILIEALTTL